VKAISEDQPAVIVRKSTRQIHRLRYVNGSLLLNDVGTDYWRRALINGEA